MKTHLKILSVFFTAFIMTLFFNGIVIGQEIRSDTIYVFGEATTPKTVGRDQAREDIAKGIVRLWRRGFPNFNKELDSLANEYGFNIVSSGCIPVESDTYYNEEVIKYLSKRNGENWWERFEREKSKLKNQGIVILNILEKIDTASAKNRLKFSKEDSLLLQINRREEDFFYAHEEFFSVEHISVDYTFYIHTIISLFPDESNHSSYGSFRIYYTSYGENSDIFRIAEDSLEVYQQALSSYNLESNFVDINYDGYNDIIISFTQNTTGRNMFNCFYLFDPDKKQFIKNSQLDSLFFENAIYIDTDSREISTGGRVGIIGFFGEDYKWNGKKYDLSAIYETEFREGNTLLLRKELIKGNWEIVKTDTLR